MPRYSIQKRSHYSVSRYNRHGNPNNKMKQKKQTGEECHKKRVAHTPSSSTPSSPSSSTSSSSSSSSAIAAHAHSAPHSSHPSTAPSTPSHPTPSLAAAIIPAFESIARIRQQMAQPNARRHSFEDFAKLDTVIAEISENVSQMTQILRDVESEAPCTSQSSIEQSVFLSATFEHIEPLMAQLQQQMAAGLELFTSSRLPPIQLLHETAAKLQQIGESALERRIMEADCEATTWPTMNAKYRVFSLTDRQVMAYMRHLASQTPSALPIFPRHLDADNTFIVMGDNGAYFFAHEFLCRAPMMMNTNGMRRNEQRAVNNDRNVFWHEASDTDDESSAEA